MAEKPQNLTFGYSMPEFGEQRMLQQQEEGCRYKIPQKGSFLIWMSKTMMQCNAMLGSEVREAKDGHRRLCHAMQLNSMQVRGEGMPVTAKNWNPIAWLPKKAKVADWDVGGFVFHLCFIYGASADQIWLNSLQKSGLAHICERGVADNSCWIINAERCRDGLPKKSPSLTSMTSLLESPQQCAAGHLKKKWSGNLLMLCFS